MSALQMAVPYSPIAGTVEFMHAAAGAIATRHAQRDYYAAVVDEFDKPEPAVPVGSASTTGFEEVRALKAELAEAVARRGALPPGPHPATLGRRLIERGERIDREAKLYYPSPGFVLMVQSMIESGLNDLDVMGDIFGGSDDQ